MLCTDACARVQCWPEVLATHWCKLGEWWLPSDWPCLQLVLLAAAELLLLGRMNWIWCCWLQIPCLLYAAGARLPAVWLVDKRSLPWQWGNWLARASEMVAAVFALKGTVYKQALHLWCNMGELSTSSYAEMAVQVLWWVENRCSDQSIWSEELADVQCSPCWHHAGGGLIVTVSWSAAAYKLILPQLPILWWTAMHGELGGLVHACNNFVWATVWGIHGTA